MKFLIRKLQRIVFYILKYILWKRPIYVGKNTFIGKKSIIMPGSKIGDNVIVGAGSVVRGTLDSNYIYAGNPIQKLMSIDDYNMRVEKFKNDILWD